MAQQGKDEHRMLFDLRGRRKNVVRVVYGVLAVLMGLSLFLVIGGFNLAELFNSGSGTGDAAKPYQEQAERIEAKLLKTPEDSDLLLSLTRAQVNSGNAQVTVESNGAQAFTIESVQEYQKANQTWSEYLETTKKPNVGVAQLMSSTLVQLAELSRSYPEATSNIEAAVEAQKIIAEQRPSAGAFTTLAYYTYFTGDFAAANQARAKAKKLAGTEKAQLEAIDQQLDQVEKQAKKYLAAKKKAEAEEKAAAAAAAKGQGSPEAQEPGGSIFGGSLGGLSGE